MYSSHMLDCYMVISAQIILKQLRFFGSLKFVNNIEKVATLVLCMKAMKNAVQRPDE